MIFAYLAGLVVLAAVLASAVRRVGTPGPAVVGGLVAGVLLGPTILGRVAPVWYEQTAVGGRQARIELEATSEWQQENPLPQALTPEEARERAFDHEVAIREKRQQLEDVRWEHQTPLRLSGFGLVGLFLLGAGVARERLAGERPDWYAWLSVGLWSALFPAATALLLLRWLEYDTAPAVAAVACLAVGPAFMSRFDREAAEAAEAGGGRLLRAAARMATLVGVAGMTWALWVADVPASAFWPAASAMAIACVGWLVPPVGSNLARAAVERILAPALAALAAAKVELFIHFELWTIVLVVLLAGDGRWLGAYLGAMLVGARRSLRSMRLVLGALSADTAQIAFTVVGLFAGVISESLAYALLFAALIMAISTNARKRIARQIEETEEELRKAEES